MWEIALLALCAIAIGLITALSFFNGIDEEPDFSGMDNRVKDDTEK